jgi:hypothetical protein
MQEAEFWLRRVFGRSIYFLFEARGILRGVRWRVNRMRPVNISEKWKT